jgi:hypothetical protein
MAGTKQARFAVVVTKETVEEWTLYVSAASLEEATEAADNIVQNCMFPDYEVIYSEYSLDPEPIDTKHEIEPTRLADDQGPVCAVCLGTVEWTGIAADDPANRSGKTIPGPWVHQRPDAKSQDPHDHG